MTFASPHWLWGIIILPIFYFVVAWQQRARKEGFKKFAKPGVWPLIAPEIDWHAGIRKHRVWLLSIAFLFLALARPQWGEEEESVQVTGMDVMLAVDLSRSMDVEDVVPSRLKKAKHLIRSMLDRLEGDRVGIVTFAASAHVAVPLTNDLNYVLEAVEVMDPSMVQNQGTDIGIALETALRAIERGAEAGKLEGADESTRSIVLISDGEDHHVGALAAAEKLKRAGVRLYVFGVGTSSGGPIPVRDAEGKLRGHKRDGQSQAVVSTFNPEALMKLAATAGGRYWSVTPHEAEVDELLKEMGTLDRSTYAERRFVIRQDRFQIPLGIAVLLLLIEMSIPSRRLRARRSVPSSRSRTSGTGVAPAVLAIFVFYSIPGRAESLDVYLKNEKGLEAYREGKVEEARDHFGSAQALNPNSPELRYNQGVVQAEKGDLDAAVGSFSAAAQGALAANDPRVAGRSLYNLGVTQTKKGELDAAIRSYITGLDVARAAGDAELESEIRRNLEMLQLLKEQQKQQKQQKQDKKDPKEGEQNPKPDEDQQDQDQKEQGSEQQNKEQEGKDEQKKPPREFTRGKPKFDSEKLSREDAERVMREIGEKEKTLQGKIQGKRGGRGSEEKDW